MTRRRSSSASRTVSATARTSGAQPLGFPQARSRTTASSFNEQIEEQESSLLERGIPHGPQQALARTPRSDALKGEPQLAHSAVLLALMGRQSGHLVADGGDEFVTG
jgi:hypothetical protein